MNPNSNQTTQKKQICIVVSEDIIEFLRELKSSLREAGYKKIREGAVVEILVRYILENNLRESAIAWARGKLAEGA